jgi:hypothetical protein
MFRNPVSVWILLSAICWFVGLVWKYIEPYNETVFILNFSGWLSFLLAIGYYCTPSNSIYGKIAFACVTVIVIGIAMKILHIDGGNAAIVVSLGVLGATYVIMWRRQRVER